MGEKATNRRDVAALTGRGGGGRGGGGGDGCHKCGQEVPDWLRREADRFKAWKERKDEEKATNRRDVAALTGRGGGGRGGGGGDGCHKCGQSGHWSRECPQGGGGG